MKRTLIALVAAAFALAAGSSFAQAPAQPAKSHSTAKKSKTKAKTAKKATPKQHASAKKAVKAPAAS